MITEDKLMAYVDGEIPAGERAAIENALAGNARLQKAVAEERLLRRKLAELYDPALVEEVPARLTRLFGSPEDRVVPLKRPAPAAPAWGWQNLSAMAASLALGVLLGHSLGFVGNGSQETSPRLDGEVAAALQTQLASAQAPDAPVQIGISFLGPEGQPCRTFETSGAAGLACRTQDEWRLRLLAPSAGPAGSEYQRAGSASALVMGSAQELIVGDPMDERQERSARDAGWPAK